MFQLRPLSPFPRLQPGYLIYGAFWIAMVLTLLLSCRHEPGGGCTRESARSEHKEDESHNMGQNCMQCHNTNGPGEGCFIVAGTVYDSLQNYTIPGGTILIYTKPDGQGELKETIEVDRNGNFYSSGTLNFAQGLYPVIIGSSGDKRFMTGPAPTGQCNSCHGVSTNRIWVR